MTAGTSHRLPKLLMLLCLAGLNPNAHAATLLDCGQVLDVERGRWLAQQRIRVDAGKITQVAAADQLPALDGDTVMDLRHLNCLPGLMDMHVHFSVEFGPRTYLERFQLNAADIALRSVGYAERTLMAGFTTVRDLGDSYNSSISLKRAIAENRVRGPRIFAAGKSLATTGGHADPTNGMRDDLTPPATPGNGVLNGVAQAREAVRQRYKDGADLIKITATGGVLSVAASGDNAQFQMDELEAVVETARDYGFHVAAHAHGAEGMKRAIRAGVASIEHGTYMDKEAIKLMKRNGTWYVPTIMAGQWVAAKSRINGFFPELVRPKAAAVGPKIHDTFRRAHKAGVKIAYGTDSGVSAHGDNAQEYALMIEGGMAPIEALRAATTHAAELLGQSAQLGQIRPDHLADIIAVAGDPLRDPQALNAVRMVMKQGQIVRRP